MKKLIAVLMLLVTVFSLTACKDNSKETPPGEVTQGITDAIDGGETQPGSTNANQSEPVSSSANENVTEESTSEESAAVMTDPSTWTKEEIVEFYKNAAINSKSQKSVEKKALSEMVVNDGDGFIGTLVEMITPFLISALEDSETVFDGITGGYENLEISDTQSVKAYKSGKYTVVEMTMKEQIDGAHGDRYGGAVGHAISVVGDLVVVQEALPMLEIGFDKADFKLHYKNATLKVKINEDGIIEKGTWSYKIDITVANLYVGGRRLPLSATVKSGYGTVDYIITVGGGF